jgi:hypothetical protein
MPAMIMEPFGSWQLNHFLHRFDDIIRLMLCVIMYFIFYFSIGFGTAFSAYHMFAIDVICEFCHIHLVQAFVLKPLKAGIGNRRSI